MNAIVIKLKKRKTDLGLTNRELATMSGVPYGTVCRLLSKENYTPNLQTLKDLAKALDVSIAYTGSNLPAARRISARWPEKTCHPAGRVRQ